LRGGRQYNHSCLNDRLTDAFSIGFSGTPVDAGLWYPELYQENLIAEEMTITSSWWLSGNGLVWWTRKVIWELRCAMDFTYMPYDAQQCGISVEEFRHKYAARRAANGCLALSAETVCARSLLSAPSWSLSRVSRRGSGNAINLTFLVCIAHGRA
jgi:hypothetical protein